MQHNFSILKGYWDGLYVEYAHPSKQTDNTLIVQVAIAEELRFDCHREHPVPFCEYLQITLTPSRFKQIVDLQIVLSDRQRSITDPAILHLARLLRDEIEMPKVLNQEFVYSIITILVTHYCEYEVVTTRLKSI